MPGSISAIREELREHADPERAANTQRYFKTGPGEYGEGDILIGVRVPDSRRVVRANRGLPLADCLELLAGEVHEERFVALLLMVQLYADSPDDRGEIYDAYLANTDRINNWDLVDTSCRDIVGLHLLGRSREPLYELAGSEDVWERRIAIISTSAFIREGDLDDTLAITELLIDDDHDLIHKACGWMLREAGKRDRDRLVSFLEAHAPVMPRTMLRYAIERFEPTERRRLMDIPRAEAG